MTVSEKLLDLLMEWEGFYTEAYPDGGGVLTIGIGHVLTRTERLTGRISINGVSIRWKDGITREQVRQLKLQDLARFEKVVNRGVKVSLEQNEFDALVSLAFNIGDGAFLKSTLLKVLNAGHKDWVPDQFKRWCKDNGRVVQGLVNRRAKEIALWKGEI